MVPRVPVFFFFNDTATTEIYTLSLHDALPIFSARHSLRRPPLVALAQGLAQPVGVVRPIADRKSTRLNSSHDQISYAVFCLKKKTRYTATPHSPKRPTTPTPAHQTSTIDYEPL